MEKMEEMKKMELLDTKEGSIIKLIKERLKDRRLKVSFGMLLAKMEINHYLYKQPCSDFGRLGVELVRIKRSMAELIYNKDWISFKIYRINNEDLNDALEVVYKYFNELKFLCEDEPKQKEKEANKNKDLKMEKILEKKVKVLELLLKNADKRCLLLSEALKVYEDENKMLKERVGVSTTSNGKKEVVDDMTTFSSRFMPNVKFVSTKELTDIIVPDNSYNSFYLHTNKLGHIVSLYKESWELLPLKEVSVYEAIQELVPEGMVYDKRSDKLIKKS